MYKVILGIIMSVGMLYTHTASANEKDLVRYERDLILAADSYQHASSGMHEKMDHRKHHKRHRKHYKKHHHHSSAHHQPYHSQQMMMDEQIGYENARFDRAREEYMDMYMDEVAPEHK